MFRWRYIAPERIIVNRVRDGTEFLTIEMEHASLSGRGPEASSSQNLWMDSESGVPHRSFWVQMLIFKDRLILTDLMPNSIIFIQQKRCGVRPYDYSDLIN